VTGYALAAHTEPSLFALVSGRSASHIADIRDEQKVCEALIGADPQIVIHMAAQALVRESYREPLATYSTNVLGTGTVLQACRALQQLECALIVTSDKVYENHGEGRPFVEGDRLGGHDPYSNSKACSELLTASFRESFFEGGAPIATARAGNVIGGGDWSQDRLIPDCVRALGAGEPVALRYPEAIRPWQHVLEPLSGYLAFAQALVQAPAATPRAVNFGPDPASFCTVREVVEHFSTRFSGRPGWRRDAGTHPKEAGALTLSSDLAEKSLGWRPRLTVGESLAWTADWYRAHAAGEDMTKYSEAQIARYESLPAGRS
jgi:CDP-glucose 4,6-dehydratase